MRIMPMLKPKRAGFTIVELLIVIVVIAILAAISVVAYTGIQERARESKITSELQDISKLLAVYNIDNSSYPSSTSEVRDSDIKSAVPNTTGSNALYCGSASRYTVFIRLDASAESRQFKVGSESTLAEVIPRVSWSPSGACESGDFALWVSYW